MLGKKNCITRDVEKKDSHPNQIKTKNPNQKCQSCALRKKKFKGTRYSEPGKSRLPSIGFP